MSDVLLGGQRVEAKALGSLGFPFKFKDLRSALEDIFPDGDQILRTTQWIPLSPEKLFPFFSDAKNLETITPPSLKFQIKEVSDETIREGTLIRYQLSLHGFPFAWKTRIENWVTGVEFVDRQLSGPYAKWVHSHRFLPVRGGTLMTDRVQFRLPLGVVGDLFALGWVKAEVQKIFQYRRKKVEELFGAAMPEPE
jgi:hypothetical protein